MRDALIKLGQRAKRGLFDWDNIIKEFKNEPPHELALETEVDFCLESVERSRVLANNIHGREWLFALNKKKIFEKLFSPNAILSEKEIIWMNWIVKEFVGKDDNAFKFLYFNHGNMIHPKFAETILITLELENEKIRDNIYKEYIILLSTYIKSSWEIFRLIDILSKRKLYSLCYHLFTKYFEIQFVFDNKLWVNNDEYIYEHRFIGELYQIVESWKCCKNEFLNSYAERLLYFIKENFLNFY